MTYDRLIKDYMSLWIIFVEILMNLLLLLFSLLQKRMFADHGFS